MRMCIVHVFRLLAAMVVTAALCVDTGSASSASDAVPPGCSAWPAAAAFCTGPPSNFEKGIGYPAAGGEAGPSTTSEVECCCACAASADCNGWTLNGADKKCFLKTRAGPSTQEPSKSAVSGLMPPRPPPPPYIPKYPTPAGAKNVLFIAVDDMRPSLGAYNFTLPGQPTHSPNLDKLATEGLLFTRAYVQYAFCSPSRNSFMTGRRPDTTGVWEFKDHFREEGVGADWVSMPEFFKQYGYLTLGGGKLYHPASATENIGMPDNDYPASWSPEYPYFLPDDDLGSQATCADQGPVRYPAHSPPAEKGEKFAWCEVDIAKEASVLYGQQVRDNCIDHLKLAKNISLVGSARPFFIGCGFHKPHAPYYAPKEFFDRLPPAEEVPLPHDPFAPVGMPMVAWHPYADVAGMVEDPPFNGTVNMTRLHIYRRAYYAAISYTDYNIGQILEALDTLGLAQNTVVVTFGDHGYQLGEHDTWSKMTNFELGVHIPLIIRAPWMSNSIGKETDVLAEMVDTFPTLAELAGLPDPRFIAGTEGINGTSLVSTFIDPTNTSIKTAAFSQFAKNNIGTSVDCQFFRNETQLMGYTIRTDEWRYTAWFRFDNSDAGWGPHFGKVFLNESLGTELYDHRGDTGKWLDWPGENYNLVNETEHASLVEELHGRIVHFIQLK
eukprot:m.229791 g.229791  ORF g.229791 m.229791 type:complete len:665 (-) comp26009_c0_seq1:104-2098(-)